MSGDLHSLDPWFLGGVVSFAVSSVAYLSAHWRSDSPSLTWPRRVLDITLLYWGLLLVCSVIQTGLTGASRLWFGLSALAIASLYRLSASRYRFESLGGSVAALASLLGLFAYLIAPHHSGGLVGSGALTAHISFVVAGLTAFAVSAALSGLYLIVERKLKSKQWVLSTPRLPSLSTLDALNLKGLLIGFPLYTIALLLGSAYIFQGQAELRSSYLIALGSWLIYGAVLQARLTAGWRGRRAAILTLVAFGGLLLVAAQYSFR